MHQDRGTIKWSSLMLPEHVEILQELWQEDRYQKKPTVDEQQMERNEHFIQEALAHQTYIQVTYYDAGTYRKEQLKVMYLEPKTNSVRFTNRQDERQSIRMDHILQVE